MNMPGGLGSAFTVAGTFLLPGSIEFGNMDSMWLGYLRIDY
jgi:hypothetical protein